MQKKVLILSLVATLGGSSLALAHDARGKRFARMDADGDGSVTQQEMLEHKRARFDEADADHDGKLTPEERRAALGKRKQRRFDKKDENGDGQLSRDELARMPDARFEKLDTDGNGSLSQSELAAGWGKAHGRGKRGHHAKWQDRTFERSELEAHAAKRFSKLDANGDGALTPDEMKRGCHGKRKGRGKHKGRGHGRGHGSAQRDAG